MSCPPCWLYASLDLIWRNRQMKKSTRLYDIRAELESQGLDLRKARPKKLENNKLFERNINNIQGQKILQSNI